MTTENEVFDALLPLCLEPGYNGPAATRRAKIIAQRLSGPVLRALQETARTWASSTEDFDGDVGPGLWALGN